MAYIDDVMESYKRWLMLGFSPRTAQTYISIVRKYLEFYGGVPPILDPEDEVDIAIEFIEKYSDKPKSRQLAAYAIKSFYNFRGRPDIASRIPSPRGSGWTPDIIPLSEDTLRYVIESLPDLRDKAILCTAYDLALRRSEVTLLKRSEFNPGTCRIIVHRLKRPKGVPSYESMQLSPWCCEIVNQYLKTRKDNLDALFVSEVRGKYYPISRELVRRTFKRLEEYLGVQGLRFHQLRHTRLTHLAQKSKDVLALAKFAGHRNPQSTMIYIHLSGVMAKSRLEGESEQENSPNENNNSSDGDKSEEMG